MAKAKGTLISCILTLAVALADGATKPASTHYSMPFNRTSFPVNFVFGAGSSAYQSEGAALIAGRGPSVWDNFARKHADKIPGRSNGDVADDFYHRYEEDIMLMKKIGFDSFRFSISWSRVFPKGKISGGVNPHGVNFYNNLINELLSSGLKPLVTLHHFDTPQALEDEYTSWLSPKIVNDYLDYADFCFKTFGDRVKFWVTINEPNSLCINGYDVGIMAPGRCSSYVGDCTAGNSATEPYIAAHHMLLAHATAVKLYREKYQPYQKGKIGISIISPWFVPKSQTTASHRAVYRSLDYFLGWFVHPITYGDYPMTIRSTVGKRLPSFTEAQSKLLKGSFDFLGLNYYTAFYVEHAPFSNSANQSYDGDRRSTLTSYKKKAPIGTPTALSWLFVYPKGIRDLLLYIKMKYNNPPIYITENGKISLLVKRTYEASIGHMGMPDLNNNSLPLKKALKDSMRIRYHHGHLSYLLKAIKEGANVKGYYVWCFWDGFEWDSGYTLRFGLTFVDYKNKLKRYLKYSAYWFQMFLLNKK